jgi:hypothetical protein
MSRVRPIVILVSLLIPLAVSNYSCPETSALAPNNPKVAVEGLHRTSTPLPSRGLSPDFSSQHVSGLSDGRFDHPPRVIDSWADLAGTTVHTAIFTQLTLTLVGVRVCTVMLPLGGLVAPAGCAIVVAIAGFVSGGLLYGLGTYRGGRIRYVGRMQEWCKRQSQYLVKNREYYKLCFLTRPAGDTAR